MYRRLCAADYDKLGTTHGEVIAINAVKPRHI